MSKPFAITLVAAAVLTGHVVLHAQQPPAPAGGAADQVAALKQTMQQGLALARKYEWTETTIISLKGEEKARKQNRCFYGADGKVQKISLDQPEQHAQPQGGGRRGGRVKEKVVEKKKDEMKDYMEKAAALIHQYVPPNPQQIQAAKDAGRVAVTPQAGQVHLAISQYLKPGDSLTIDMDPAAKTIAGLGVNSYLDTKEDVVTLAVQMNTLPDGAIYAGRTTLDAKAKNITVVIQNSGHRPVQQ
jgi:hypothetical protein